MCSRPYFEDTSPFLVGFTAGVSKRECSFVFFWAWEEATEHGELSSLQLSVLDYYFSKQSRTVAV